MKTSAAFDRQTLRQRGHFSNYPALNPVLRLEFGPSALRITRRFGASSHAYRDLAAKVLETYTFKSYGKGGGAYIKQTLVTLSTTSGPCSFDLSGQFPDFNQRNEILKLISEKIPVTKASRSLAQVKRGHMFVGFGFAICLFVLVFVLRRYGI